MKLKRAELEEKLENLTNHSLLEGMYIDLAIVKLEQRGLWKDPLRAWRNWLARTT